MPIHLLARNTIDGIARNSLEYIGIQSIHNVYLGHKPKGTKYIWSIKSGALIFKYEMIYSQYILH